MTASLHGIGASKGIAIGPIHVVARGELEVTEYAIPPRRIQREVSRYERALARARSELEEVKSQLSHSLTADISAFIDTHLLMLADAAFSSVPVDIIRERRCNAEWALKIQRDTLTAVFEAMDDAYLRTRKDDVGHVANRIQQALRQVSRRSRPAADKHLAGRIVFADDLPPADTVLMQHQGIAAFLTEYGGPTSHTAILARSLGIPAVVGLHHARHYLREDDVVVVDGREGVVLFDVEPGILAHYRRLQREIDRYYAARRRLRRRPVVTADGERIGLLANVELPDDIEAAADLGAEGIGLYRTEYLFMNRREPPAEEEQFESYCDLVNRLRGAPVTIRTLDLGADKQVDGGRPGAPVSTNPALGLRAVRLCLKEPGMFRPQIRAILRASAFGPVRMMIPMMSSAHEIAQVLHIVGECRNELVREDVEFDAEMPIGAMIEVPAAAVCADIFARQMDFLSIGTNDLIQYTIAADRIDDEVSYLYDPLNPAVLRLIRTTIQAGEKCGTPVAMCGEMAGDARYTRLLLGLGLREFSVHPNSLLEVKQAMNESSLPELRSLVARFMRAVKPATRASLLDAINRSG